MKLFKCRYSLGVLSKEISWVAEGRDRFKFLSPRLRIVFDGENIEVRCGVPTTMKSNPTTLRTKAPTAT